MFLTDAYFYVPLVQVLIFEEGQMVPEYAFNYKQVDIIQKILKKIDPGCVAQLVPYASTGAIREFMRPLQIDRIIRAD